MAKPARAIVPEIPHRVTQCGNRRMQTFFRDEDYQGYLALLVDGCGGSPVALAFVNKL